MNYIRSTAAPCTTDEADEPVVVLGLGGGVGCIGYTLGILCCMCVCTYVCGRIDNSVVICYLHSETSMGASKVDNDQHNAASVLD